MAMLRVSTSVVLTLSSSSPDISLHFPNSSGPRSERELESLYEFWLARHGKAYNGVGEKEARTRFLGTRPDAKMRVMKVRAASDRYAVRAGDRLPRAVDWWEKGAVRELYFIFPS
ncbi:hypothetical protein SAY87_022601 [Trapa incisa]|uniref:Cathepsin propeptide inhibitor domain-containing protein n=1 Tax=Trapa incisa TaxID=236973 RepID=A0AAN7Q9G0_9MYRT|nr:hypothetical protein SAY87_022601 [Trapa incisa]